MGRKSTYTTEIADEICERLAAGESLRQICGNDFRPDFPPEATVRNWAVDDIQGFAARYARARGTGIDAIVESTLEIADDLSEDPKSRQVRIEARKWFASKLRPDKYGDRTAVDIGGQAGNQLRIVVEGADGKPLP